MIIIIYPKVSYILKKDTISLKKEPEHTEQTFNLREIYFLLEI